MKKRSAALERLEARRDFQKGLVVYVLVNALLVVIWFLGGDRGLFWPIWPIAGWGIGVLIQWWSVYRRKPITEDDIDREMVRANRSPPRQAGCPRSAPVPGPGARGGARWGDRPWRPGRVSVSLQQCPFPDGSPDSPAGS